MLHKLLLFFLFFVPINGYKILIFNPKLAHSHINFIGQMTRLLIEAGHDVVVISINANPELKDPYHAPGKIYYSKPSQVLVDLLKRKDFNKMFWKLPDGVMPKIRLVSSFVEAVRAQGETSFYDQDLENFVLSQNFDAALAEDIYPVVFGLFKHWKINTTMVFFSSIMHDLFYPMYGIPFPTSYLPSLMSPFHDKMTYGDRVLNILLYNFFPYLISQDSDYGTLKDLFDERFGKGFYEGNKIMTKCSFAFINSNPYLDIPSPKSPKMIEIGGIGIPKQKPLDKEFDEILNRRNKTIYMSFGTLAKSSFMEQDMKDDIIKTIKSLPDITFIWKYETPEDGLGDGVDNLILSKWVPQSDLLNDKRLSLFITHGGMASIIELAFTNVTALAIPGGADQPRNAKLLERLEIGATDSRSILNDPEAFRKKILETMNNEKYKQNSIRTAEMLKSRYPTSEELFVKSVEFACKFGQLPMIFVFQI
uniref:glucuronosyltransferase n=1 Tax=Parastrongyloides trichosuri TaxID=131310 RepID=A0A0N4ZLP8_PARTI